MDQIVLKDLLNEAFESYVNAAQEKKLIFRVMADSGLPNVIEGNRQVLGLVLKTFLKESFSHTMRGKVLLAITYAKEDLLSMNSFAVGDTIDVRYEVLDTGESYEITPEWKERVETLLKQLGATLSITNIEQLGASVSFQVKHKVSTEETIGEGNFMEVLLEQAVEAVEEDVHNPNDDIAGIDMERGMAFVGNNKEFYQKILVEFVKSGAGFIDDLKNMVQNEDWGNYQIKVHSVKSGSYSIGANDLGDAAKEMEFAAKDSEYERIVANNDKLIQLLSETLAHIQDYLDANDIVIDKMGNTLKDRLAEAIDNFDQEEALRLLEEMKLEDGNPGILSEIQKALDNLNYLEAQDLLNTL
ncbi:MAG: hypothetical protein Q4D51_10835 [Eubacteriales bacterium]|nr:hypothetical protein [Eubacteriales bacterium]